MTEVVVVGGGPAGAALATRLSRAGREVVVIERDGPAHKVCGEFLSHEAGLYLRSLGLSLEALGAVPIDALRLCESRHVTTVKLPFAAWSLSRLVLDEALLDLAVDAGATLRRGAKVVGLEPASNGFRATVVGGGAVDARAAFLATGKHDLRGFKRPGGLQDDLVAFKLHWRLLPDQVRALSRHIELVLFDGGYAGLSLVEGELANLCLVVRRRRFSQLGQRWDGLLSSLCTESRHLRERLAGARPCWPKPLALSSIPYGYVRRRSAALWHLGDQAAVIPSFSGDGMSIALHSADMAATAYLAGASADTFQRRLAADVTRQVMLSTALSHGLVRKHAQTILGGAARVVPGLLAMVASRTRLPDAVLGRT